jgi:hypothetical protein
MLILSPNVVNDPGVPVSCFSFHFRGEPSSDRWRFSVPPGARQEKGLAEYGLLANRYVFGFEKKVDRRRYPRAPGRLVNSLVAGSLADLGNSYSVVREMRVVPFRREDVARLDGATAAPLLPLMLTIVSLEELLTRLARSFSDVLEQEGYVVRLRQRVTSRLPN